MAAVQPDKYQHKKLVSLLMGFEECFDETLVKWDTNPVDLRVERESKLFNSRYFLVPKTNKDNLCKKIQHLVDIWV